MYLQGFVLLAISCLAIAGPQVPPPSGAVPADKQPNKCLERLDEFPNRSNRRFDIFGGRCVKARTYKGKVGPYNGDFFFEACCKNGNDDYTDPTSINVDKCLVYNRDKATLQWNNENRNKIRDHCSNCGLDMGGDKTSKPYLKCRCKNKDNKEVDVRIGAGGDEKGAREPKNSFWINSEGQIVCKK
ncbi:uncharacterized protein CTRU02_214681 [Colletotrichum truncatum]|uniref:Uncharacterized protein n=1 Tax=Colletotrichum truncatum TaxID=5467 RepID=A0ACC3YFG4_COLTU|nr:uncharacterized protein CTRU02_09627 [Colletotrichum truncatum]KAF6788309.1 hypothetical protein CTRU02_09627 [Colletotrichum truncatum]